MSSRILPLIISLVLLTGCSNVQYTPSSRVLITAAHLISVEGYTRVYADWDLDYAVFVKDDYTPTTPPIGSTVTFLKTTGTIESIDGQTFSVKPADVSQVVPGVSGSPILYEGVPIGFISGVTGEGTMWAVFY